MVVLGILVVLFAISNRSVVILELWPLPYFVPFPFYGAVLIAAFIGFVGGSVVAWFSAGSTRRKARHAGRKVTGLEKDLDNVQCIVMSDTGHNMYMERPDTLAKIVSDFVNSHELPRRV